MFNPYARVWRPDSARICGCTASQPSSWFKESLFLREGEWYVREGREDKEGTQGRDGGLKRTTSPLPSMHIYRKQPNSSVSTTLFDDERTNDVVVNCITEQLIGIRPKHLDTVNVCQLRPNDHKEPDHHRKAIFDTIFHKRVWGINSKVDFSSSGRQEFDVDANNYFYVYTILVSTLRLTQCFPCRLIFTFHSIPRRQNTHQL